MQRPEIKGATMEPNPYDQAIRTEVLATLKANPAASLDTLLGNWRYHRHGIVEEAETARVETILDDEPNTIHRHVVRTRRLAGPVDRASTGGHGARVAVHLRGHYHCAGGSNNA